MPSGFRLALAMSAAIASSSLAVDSLPIRQIAGASGSGSITGRVIDASSRQPVRGANVHVGAVPDDSQNYPIQDCCGTVMVRLEGDYGRVTTTDADGRFALANLPARAFELRADKPGWMSAWWGQTSPSDGGRWIELQAGQRVDGLEIALPRGPIVGGRVVDERGEPVTGLRVLVTPAALGIAAPAYAPRTDDRGNFRSAVRPGEYVVSTVAYPDFGFASSWPQPNSKAPASAYPRLFFPQATSIDGATRLSLGPGDQRVDLDFVLKPERAFRVSISVAGEALDHFEHLSVELLAWDERLRFPLAIPPATAGTGVGLLGFAGVPPGRYVVHAHAGPVRPLATERIAPLSQLPSGQTWWADQEIVVADRDLNVPLALQPGVRISGRVEFDGVDEAPPPNVLNNRALVVERADGSGSVYRGVFLPGGRFSTIQIEPGRYVVRPGSPPGWQLKSVMAGGRDIRDYPVDLARSDVHDVVITFTDRRSAVAGRLIRDGPDDLTRGWITVFPTDRAYWAEYGVYPRRIAFIECGRSGLFEAEVPPGSYYVVATRWSTRGRLTVDQLALLAASATPVVVGDNQTVYQQLRFSRGR